MQVAIDTSTDTASLALVEDSVILAELTWRCGRNHTTQLLPRLTHLLEQSKVDLESATAIFVAIGPGSFNGLRVGISTAKGLALSLGIPIIGIGTLEVEAYPHANTGLPICAIANAGRGEIAAALYQMEGEEWHRHTAEHITTVEALCAETTARTLFCGEYVTTIATQLQEGLKDEAVIPSPASRLRRAAFLAELGQKRRQAGDYDNPATLQPIYLRRPSITKPKHNLWR